MIRTIVFLDSNLSRWKKKQGKLNKNFNLYLRHKENNFRFWSFPEKNQEIMRGKFKSDRKKIRKQNKAVGDNAFLELIQNSNSNWDIIRICKLRKSEKKEEKLTTYLKCESLFFRE